MTCEVDLWLPHACSCIHVYLSPTYKHRLKFSHTELLNQNSEAYDLNISMFKSSWMSQALVKLLEYCSEGMKFSCTIKIRLVRERKKTQVDILGGLDVFRELESLKGNIYST